MLKITVGLDFILKRGGGGDGTSGKSNFRDGLTVLLKLVTPLGILHMYPMWVFTLVGFCLTYGLSKLFRRTPVVRVTLSVQFLSDVGS